MKYANLYVFVFRPGFFLKILRPPVKLAPFRAYPIKLLLFLLQSADLFGQGFDTGLELGLGLLGSSQVGF